MGDSSYVIDQYVGYAILAIFVLMTIALIILLFSSRKSKKREKHLLQEKHKITNQNQTTEKSLIDTTKQLDNLKLKYDELSKKKEYMKKIAYTDYLTELPNRVSFTEMLDNILLTLRQEEIIAIMDIDIDNFKMINDSLGHSYGDELLIDVTHRLKQAITEDDYLARIGGDEFVVVTQNMEDFSQYEDKIKKIMKVFSYPFVLSTQEFFITVSIGITLAPRDGKTTQGLVKNADLAMYEAKYKGKNTYCYFDETINKRLMKNIEVQSELRKAIEKREFEVYYQAQIDLTNNKIVGFEALLRWNHPDKGIIYPKDFIHIAEETGLIVPIGKLVLWEACKQLKAWTEMGYTDIVMAVNLSARQFKDKNFTNMVFEIIEDTKIDGSHLELEITETIALDDLDYTTKTIEELKEAGIRFSLDDFGTGYSSMSYLKRLPVDNIKIDKSFLDPILESTDDQKIVETIINLAHVLNLEVIAEGVEYEAQETFLKQANCHKAQGYLYSKPIPKAQALTLLQEFPNLSEG